MHLVIFFSLTTIFSGFEVPNNPANAGKMNGKVHDKRITDVFHKRKKEGILTEITGQKKGKGGNHFMLTGKDRKRVK